jgi:intein/homing endonuclease
MNGFVLKRINKIDIIRYRGKAYSLETEGDNNYIANGVVVNNV